MSKQTASGAPKKRFSFKNIPYEKQKALYGYGFIALWLIGTILWFLIPLVESFTYSFRDVNPDLGGMAGPWVGLDNYYYAFFKDPDFRETLIEVMKDTVVDTPSVIIFALFIAVILNEKFKGRTFARAVFFLPVIIATGPVYAIISGNMDTSQTSEASQFSMLFETDMVSELLTYLGVYNISQEMTDWITRLTNGTFDLVWSSGIQILLFLAGLQTISTSAKEAAQIEGATGWEFFWKITFPCVSPMILANLIYTIIDSFTKTDNAVMTRVLAKQSEWAYGVSAAMAWSYFLIVLILVGIVVAVVNRFVFYEVD